MISYSINIEYHLGFERNLLAIPGCQVKCAAIKNYFSRKIELNMN